MAVNHRIVLASRPAPGLPVPENFRIEEAPIPAPAEGQVQVRVHYLSLDPYMRGRMDAAKSYAKPVEIGEVMVGGTVGEVTESRHPKFAKGDFVAGSLGWQEWGVADARAVTKIDPQLAPISAYLGTLGMPGITAWVGLLDIAQPRAGETVVVSAASGAVGSVVGQLAKIRGCRAVGIAGGKAKCDYVVHELGFDVCIDYKAGRLRDGQVAPRNMNPEGPDSGEREGRYPLVLSDALKAAAPNGIDVYFENVGGETLDTVLRLMNPFGRVAVCGMISQYNASEIYGVREFRSILVNRLRVQGFIVSDRMELWPKALAELGGWFREGKLKYRESVAQGLEAAPRAFIGMLRGENFGKQLVRLV